MNRVYYKMGTPLTSANSRWSSAPKVLQHDLFQSSVRPQIEQKRMVS